MCFVAGGCLSVLVMIGAHNRDRRVLVVLALAYKIGGALLL